MSATHSTSSTDENEQDASRPFDATTAVPAASAATTKPLMMYSTTVSDVGYVRSNNQDSSFAGRHLAAVCDGMGGHAGGDTASTIAIRSLAHIERDNTSHNVESVAEMMTNSVLAAHDAIVGQAKQNRKLAGMGTTVTAVSLVDGYWVLAHIGDSRAYLLRDGQLTRVTKDHSYVQHLIDTHRITEAEAKNHPQRNVVMRVLGDFDIDPRPDISIREAEPGDRWLLCSDGLCGVLESSTIEERLREVNDPEQCAQDLVSMALRAGSTDNVTAVITEAVTPLNPETADDHESVLLIGGAVCSSIKSISDNLGANVMVAPQLKDTNNPAQRAAELTQPKHADGHRGQEAATPKAAQPAADQEAAEDPDLPNTDEIPVVQKKDGSVSSDPHDPEVADAIKTHHRETAKQVRKHHSRVRAVIATIVIVVLLALGAAGFVAYRWSQSQYYLGESAGMVTIYQGVPTNVFGLSLSHEVERTDIDVDDLPNTWREQLNRGITVSSYKDAKSHADMIRRQAEDMLQEQQEQPQIDDGSGQFGGDEQTPDTSTPDTETQP